MNTFKGINLKKWLLERVVELGMFTHVAIFSRTIEEPFDVDRPVQRIVGKRHDGAIKKKLPDTGSKL